MKCTDSDCICNGSGDLIWVIDIYRWSYQLLCNKGGLIFMEVEGDLEIYDYVGDAPGMKGNPILCAPPLPTPDDYTRCINCNRLILKSGHHQKFCAACATVKRRLQKAEWIRRRRAQECGDSLPNNGHDLDSERQ